MYLEGSRDSIKGKKLALHTADPGSIPGTADGI